MLVLGKAALPNAGFLLCLLITASIAGCSLPVVDEVKLEDRYVADFSLPVGHVSLAVNDMVEAKGLDPVLPDTFSVPANLFVDSSIYYVTPSSFDTIISMEFNLDRLGEYHDNVTHFMLRTNIINGSHASVALQIYFRYSGTSVPVDSVFSEGPLNVSAAGIGSGNVTVPVKLMRNDEYFDSDRVDRLRDVANLDVHAVFKFPQGQLPAVGFYNDELLWIQLALRAGIDGDPNEL
jgi:hypothetical protein